MVTVQYLKYPDTIHWRHEMIRLGTDDHGIWLGGPPGTTVQRGHEPAKAWEEPFVQLIPADRWWTLIYNGDDTPVRIYVDITTPACWLGDERVEMVDLDLDVVLRQDGGVEVLDRDEFDVHRRELSYPGQLVRKALTAAEEVRQALSARREPFGQAAVTWFRRVS